MLSSKHGKDGAYRPSVQRMGDAQPPDGMTTVVIGRRRSKQIPIPPATPGIHQAGIVGTRASAAVPLGGSECSPVWPSIPFKSILSTDESVLFAPTPWEPTKASSYAESYLQLTH
ncbi:hypothetical protein BHM03_00043155 [Ensete ventricosum]|nr:hypothetical protein BHM03_00043155 [Ensete ventricosum]